MARQASERPTFRAGFARSQVSVKTVLTVGATVLALAGAVWAVSHTLLALTLTVGSALIAVALNHGVEALASRGLSRGVAVAVVMLALVLLAAALAWSVIPTAAAQISQLVERAPELLEQIRHSAAFAALDRRFDLDRRLEEFLQSGPSIGAQAVETSVAAVGTVARGVVAAVTLFFTVTFMLLFGGRLMDAILAETVPANRERYERVLAKVYRSIGGYLSGLALIAAVNATLTTAFLAIVGVPFFLPLGILSGLGSFIPYVGAITAGALISVVALASQGLWTGVAAVAYYVTYQNVVENHILVPLVYKRTVHLNPLVTLLAVVFLGDAAGMVGAILAVPAVAVGQIVLREVLLLRREGLHVPATGEVTEAMGGAQPPRPPDRTGLEDKGPPVPH